MRDLVVWVRVLWLPARFAAEQSLDWMRGWVRTLLLMVAGYAGAFTVLWVEIPTRTWADVLLPVLFLGPPYLGMFLAQRWMWRQPPDRRYLGLTRGTWFFLILVAYGAGAGFMLAS